MQWTFQVNISWMWSIIYLKNDLRLMVDLLELRKQAHCYIILSFAFILLVSFVFFCSSIELEANAPESEPSPPAVLDPNYCGSCYGSESEEGQCCNTCAEVREAYRKKGWAFSNPETIEQVDFLCSTGQKNIPISYDTFHCNSVPGKVFQKTWKSKGAKDAKSMAIS